MSSCSPTRNIVPHTSLHDQPCHKTMKKYEVFEGMVISLPHSRKFATQSWFEMSLNIDIKRILPVKVSGVCPNELSRLLILSQSYNVVNLGKIFHSNSADSPLMSSKSL